MHIIFAPVLFVSGIIAYSKKPDRLSRKAEGYGPLKPWQPAAF